MKKKVSILAVLMSLCFLDAFSQDTIIIYKNFKTKIGIKSLFERSSDYSLSSVTSPVNSFGLQIIHKISNFKNSIESGIYLLQRANIYYYSNYNLNSPLYGAGTYKVLFRNLHIPVNYRFDLKFFYATGGIYMEYFLSNKADISGIIEETDNYGHDRKFNLGYNFSLGTEKEITKSISVFF